MNMTANRMTTCARFMRRRFAVDEHGSALVEMALVLPLVMALLLGIFTGGSAYFRKISLVDAARDGARYGASLKVGDNATWAQAVKDRVAQLSGGQVTSADVCASLVVPTGSDMACGVADPTGASTDPVVGAPASIVKVSVSTTAKVEFFFFSQNVNLNANVAARYER